MRATLRTSDCSRPRSTRVQACRRHRLEQGHLAAAAPGSRSRRGSRSEGTRRSGRVRRDHARTRPAGRRSVAAEPAAELARVSLGLRSILTEEAESRIQIDPTTTPVALGDDARAVRAARVVRALPLVPAPSEGDARALPRLPRDRAAADAAPEREGRAARGARSRRSSRPRARRSSISPSGTSTRRSRSCGAARTEPRVLLQARVEGTIGSFAATGIADLVIVEPGETAAPGHGRRREGEPARQARAPDPGRVLRPAHPPARRSRRASRSRRCAAASGASRRGRTTSSRRSSISRAYEEAVELLVDAESSRRASRGRAARGRALPPHLQVRRLSLQRALHARGGRGGEPRARAVHDACAIAARSSEHGVRTVRELAELKGLPARGDYTLAAARSRAEPSSCRALNAEWPLGANLDLHVQRARARRAQLAPGGRVASAGSTAPGFGTLPEPDAFPGSCRSSSTRSTTSSRTGSTSRPRSSSARGASGRSSSSPTGRRATRPRPRSSCAGSRGCSRRFARSPTARRAYLHVYVYDTYDQKVVLEAIRRNLDLLAGLPDFFDLLTETAATSQSMFSFLAQEVRERKNLGILCHSLPLAARRLGFDWAFEGVELHRVFQARVFDNRRTLPDEPLVRERLAVQLADPARVRVRRVGAASRPRRRRASAGCSSRSGSRAISCCCSRARGSARSSTSSRPFRCGTASRRRSRSSFPSAGASAGKRAAARGRAARVPLHRAPHEAAGAARAVRAADRAPGRERLVAARRGARGLPRAGRAASGSASISPASTRSRRCSRWARRKATGW